VTKLLVSSLLAAALCVGSAGAGGNGGRPVALVTAERQNQLLAVTLPQGKVVGRVALPADPQNVIAGPGLPAVVVSAAGRAVTLLDPHRLRIVRVFRGFRSPHLAAFAPDGEYVYVTDDGSGDLVVIRLARPRIVARVFVGIGAHHLSVDPAGRRLWIALGERARTVAIVDTARREHPRLAGRLHPPFSVHDLAFGPDGRRVWLTSDDRSSVHVVDARTHRLLFAVPAGPPPQHVAFDASRRGRAWVTSGYGRRIELVDARTGRVLRTARAPYGSFNLATGGGLVVTSSLLNGTLGEFDQRLRPLRAVRVGDSTRDVAVTVW
jgi:DNA-binding beta-propeller fold protein YncE